MSSREIRSTGESTWLCLAVYRCMSTLAQCAFDRTVLAAPSVGMGDGLLHCTLQKVGGADSLCSGVDGGRGWLVSGILKNSPCRALSLFMCC